MAYLLVHHPGHADVKVALAGRELTVGRLTDNELSIDAESVSRHHAVIKPNGEGHVLVDLGSRNGTWVNGKRASDATVPLREGDEVALGGQGVVLRYFADESLGLGGLGGDATAFFAPVPGLEKRWMPDILLEGERWIRVFRFTPWLRLAGAVLGAAAAALAFAFWLTRFLSG